MSNRLPRTIKASGTEEAATVETPNWDQVTGWKEAMIPAQSSLSNLQTQSSSWMRHLVHVRALLT